MDYSDCYCEDAYGYVYITWVDNPDSEFNGYYYIGQRLSSRDKLSKDKIYYGSGRKIKNYISKWRTLGLNRMIIDYADDQDELNWLEEKLVGDDYMNKINCLNLCSGGKQKKMSEESKLKNRLAHLGKHLIIINKPSKEFYQNINKGRIRTEETKRKISEAKKGSKPWNTGMKMSKEYCEKLSQAHKGIPSKRKGTKLGRHTSKYGKKYGHWYNNGVVSMVCEECPEGFTKGRLPLKEYKRSDKNE